MNIVEMPDVCLSFVLMFTIFIIVVTQKLILSYTKVYGKPFAPSLYSCIPCIFENHTLKALNISFKKVVLPGRVKCGGTEEDIVVAQGCEKRKN